MEIKAENPAIICLQETMLGNKSPADPKGYSYKAFSSSDLPIPGTGILTAIRNDIPYYEIPLNTQLQAKAYRVRLSTEITICNIYIDHQVNLTLGTLQALFHQLPPPFAVLGDFNARNPLWGDTVIDNRGRGTVVEDFILQYQACIINNGLRTHFHTQTGTESAIDLSIVSPELVPDLTWQVSDCSRGSDHFPINIRVNVRDAVLRHPKYILDKADWTLFTTLTYMGEEDEGGQ